MHRLLLVAPAADWGMARPEPRQLGAAGGRAPREAGQCGQRAPEDAAGDCAPGEWSVGRVTGVIMSCLQGRQSPGASLTKVLEEVTALYSWDRPALFSPIKSAKKSELKFANSVFVITKLPQNLQELNTFLGNDPAKKVKPKVREVGDCIASKRVRNHFTGELSISFHLLNVDNVDMDIDIDIVQVIRTLSVSFE